MPYQRPDRPSNADLLALYEQVESRVDRTAEHLGVPRRTVSDWIKEAKVDQRSEFADWEVVGASINASGGVSRRLKPSTRIVAARTEGWKRPKPKPPKKSAPQLIVAGGDVHAPLQNRVMEAKFESFLEDNQPQRFTMLGDLAENAGTSKWKDRPGQPTEQESIDEGYRFLRRKLEICPNMQLDWIEGNHDLRPEDYVRTNAPMAANLCQAEKSEPVNSIEHFYRLDELGVNYIREYPLSKIKLAPNLVITHGGAVKKGAGASALANLEKRGYCIVTGHTHRLGIVFKTTLDADDHPSTLLGAETGTFKLIEPEAYDVAPDHQNGFVTITLWPDGQFHIEPALFSGGYLRWRDKRY